MNELPMILPFNCALVLKQMLVSAPAWATGKGMAVTFTRAVALQLPVLAVTS